MTQTNTDANNVSKSTANNIKFYLSILSGLTSISVVFVAFIRRLFYVKFNSIIDTAMSSDSAKLYTYSFIFYILFAIFGLIWNFAVNGKNINSFLLKLGSKHPLFTPYRIMVFIVVIAIAINLIFPL